MSENDVKNIYGTPVSEYESTEKENNADTLYVEKVCCVQRSYIYICKIR